MIILTFKVVIKLEIRAFKEPRDLIWPGYGKGEN